MSKFSAAVVRVQQRREALIPELIIAGFAFFGAWYLSVDQWHASAAASWKSLVLPDGRISFAGVWNQFVAISFLQFVFLRWLWRLIIWTCFLYEMSRLDLKLVATHADQAGGLGFLGVTHSFLGVFSFGWDAVLSADAAFRVYFEGATLQSFELIFAAYIVLNEILFVGPLLIFFWTLLHARLEGLRYYSALTNQYNRAFHARWIKNEPLPEEPLLEYWNHGNGLQGKTLFVVFLLMIGLNGCASIGPGTIGRDRLNYEQAIAESWKRQMLDNLVKLRYGDTPLFLDVASVINSYGLETQLSLAASWAHIVGVGGATDAQSLGAASRYTDKPTITYSRVLGKRFTTSLMTPIPPGVVISLLQAGWAADAVFRAMVTSVNGIQNRYGAGARARGADPEFYRLISALRRIQSSGAVGMRIERTKEQEWAVMSLAPKKLSKELEEDIRLVREILGLRQGLAEFRVVFGSAPRGDDEVAMDAGDLDGLRFIDRSAASACRGRPCPKDGGVCDTDKEGGYRPMVRIQSGSQRPADAFVAVRYWDHWFWVADRDYPSKAIFSFLLILLSLTETDPGRGTPLVTIPAGG
ncbi:MAG: hypothetical protein HY695_00615 [Deltaproteobacteria bacterium]|nr:hypothetical protein [Deltaproteobacteria bacterium]